MSTQQTLTGDDADGERTRPETMRYCQECNEWLLRSSAPHHEHVLADGPETSDDDSDDDSEESEPEQVGNWYTVRMHYSMEYVFRVAASSENRAEDLAKQKKLEGRPRPTDGHHVHTDVECHAPIFENDEAAGDNNLSPY